MVHPCTFLQLTASLSVWLMEWLDLGGGPKSSGGFQMRLQQSVYVRICIHAASSLTSNSTTWNPFIASASSSRQ